MDELKKEAKELGIRGYHLMKEETLIKKIKEAKDDVVEAVSETVEAVDAISVATASVAEVVHEVEDVIKDPAKALELIARAVTLRNVMGERDPEYLKHVSAYRDYMPEEYNRAKENIKDWL